MGSKLQEQLCNIAGGVVGGCSGILAQKALDVYIPADKVGVKPWVYAIGSYGIKLATVTIVSTQAAKDFSSFADALRELKDVITDIRKEAQPKKEYSTVKDAEDNYISETEDVNPEKEADDGGSEDAGHEQSAAE